MGGVGRPKKSDSEKDLKGTLRIDRTPVQDESMLDSLPTTPRKLSKTAKKIYKSIGALLIEKRLLTLLDLPALERYCSMAAMWEDNLEVIISAGTPPQEFYKYLSIEKSIKAFEDTYGLNPKSRKALGVGNKTQTKSKLRKMLDSKLKVG